MMRFIITILSVGLAAICSGVVSGQDWPAKPIRIITGGVGGGGDINARMIGQRISGPLGQSVIVDNRASGFVPGQVAASSPPDGYTILLYGATLYLETLLREKAPYDTLRDFAPITLMAKEPSILMITKFLPVKDLKGLVALGKARPGQLNYGGGGAGTTSTLGFALFAQMTGMTIVRINYKSSQERFLDLERGEVQIGLTGANGAMPYVQSGRLRALGISTAEPSPMFPGLPTMASVAPGYEVVGITGFWAPAKTPDAIVRRLNQEIVRAIHQPDIKEKIVASGNDVIGTTPEEFAAWLKIDIVRMEKVIKDSGVKQQ